MSAPRSARRQKARQEARKTEAANPPAMPRNPAVERLRWRMRGVLLLTTLIGLVILRVFNAPIAVFLAKYGLAAKLGLVMVLLSPALFTLMVGLGQLKDQK